MRPRLGESTRPVEKNKEGNRSGRVKSTSTVAAAAHSRIAPKISMWGVGGNSGGRQRYRDKALTPT